MEENEVVVISIIIQDDEAVGQVNDALHEYRQYVVGRMGIPYRSRGISIICVVFDAPQDVTGTLSGKLDQLSGVTTETLKANL